VAIGGMHGSTKKGHRVRQPCRPGR
jgi:hypothetical protein